MNDSVHLADIHSLGSPTSPLFTYLADLTIGHGHGHRDRHRHRHRPIKHVLGESYSSCTVPSTSQELFRLRMRGNLEDAF